jgi:hypothetical protein
MKHLAETAGYQNTKPEHCPKGLLQPWAERRVLALQWYVGQPPLQSTSLVTIYVVAFQQQPHAKIDSHELLPATSDSATK